MKVPFPYTLKSTKLSKSIKITVKNNGDVLVTKPWLVPKAVAEQFLHTHTDWVLKRLEKIRYPEQNNDSIWFRGINYQIVYKTGRFSAVFKDGKVEISCVAANMGKRQLISHLIKIGKKDIVNTVREQAKRMGLTYSSITVRDQSTRWGSCSAKGSLNFSWRLVMAPPESLTYVVIHELAHLKHLDHSKNFWNFVERFDPNYRENRRWLKRHQHQLQFIS